MRMQLVLKNLNEIKASDMLDGSFGIITDGQFAGEIVFRNVAGLHGLTGNRYWPSEYIERHSDNACRSSQPDFKVRVLEDGDTLVVTTKKTLG
jgi:hypothetical protein